jgi:CspA family cold shock protein
MMEKKNMEDVFEGEVIWFDPKAGYGFIKWEQEEDMFVHFSDVVCEGFKTLKKGQKVRFGVGKNNTGKPKAIDVEVII